MEKNAKEIHAFLRRFGDRRGSRDSGGGRGNEVARRPEDPFAAMDGMFGGRGMGGTPRTTNRGCFEVQFRVVLSP